ncbi:DUF6247 family protein [Spirillospora sp. NPDC052269]
MTAQPLSSLDPEDPSEILKVLPESWHEAFLTEYREALEAAHEVWRWRQLRELLHLWRLRAAAYSTSGFDASVEEAWTARPEDLHSLPQRPDPR